MALADRKAIEALRAGLPAGREVDVEVDVIDRADGSSVSAMSSSCIHTGSETTSPVGPTSGT